MGYQEQSIVLITGAASGLGLALTQIYVAKGHHVIMVDIQADQLHQESAQLGGQTTPLVADITDQTAIDQLVYKIHADFGRLDTLINNAGITHRSLVENTDNKVFAKVMDVDYHGPVNLAVAALPLLKQCKGSIINIGSMAGWMPVLGRAGYCAAKSALHQFFEVLRCELKQYGVHILMVYPSFLDTPIETNALSGSGEKATHKRSTVGNMGSAIDTAELIYKYHQLSKPRLFPDRMTFLASILYKLAPDFFLRKMMKKFSSELSQTK
ncbi:SDR family NAD(P)-dependent oxidoreductase [Bermanella sp. R86510]|uniref:SDR family NAD(P)-dependent oxidoreductase n=1 Tax=unclassified Bermanella TaxID=2627862 RepID=UPI0037CB1F2D